MIFFHSFNPLRRIIVLILLLMFGSFGLGAKSLKENIVGICLLLLALLLACDTVRLTWAWIKSYAGKIEPKNLA